jgi:hypothetical protein
MFGMNALDECPFYKKVNYIRKMRQNGEQLNKKPRILLSTIHGGKRRRMSKCYSY